MATALYRILLALSAVLLPEVLPTQAVFSSAARHATNTVFKYPGQVQSERELATCGEWRACNIVRQRFWLPPLVERQCRCGHSAECSAQWQSDDRTVALDSRAQFKFCSAVTELPQCRAQEAGLSVAEQPAVSRRAVTHREPPGRRPPPPRNVTALCHCPAPHYWQADTTNTTNTTNSTTLQDGTLRHLYTCTQLKRCSPLELCGHVRLDHHSTYHRCSCPAGHLCIAKEKTPHQVHEALYHGPAYRAHCIPTTRL